jgi:hypothetical protein
LRCRDLLDELRFVTVTRAPSVGSLPALHDVQRGWLLPLSRVRKSRHKAGFFDAFGPFA